MFCPSIVSNPICVLLIVLIVYSLRQHEVVRREKIQRDDKWTFSEEPGEHNLGLRS